MKKLNNFFVKSISVIFILIISFLTINSLFFTCTIDIAEKTHYSKDNFILNIIYIIAFIMIISFFKIVLKKIKEKHIKILNIIFAVVYILLLLAFVNKMKINPTSDQKFVFNAAQEFFDGNYRQMHGYLEAYPNQYGIVLFFYLIKCIPILTNLFSPIFIQYLNIAFLFLCFLFIEKIRKTIANSSDNKSIGIVYLMIFLPISCYITFVYGTILGLTLSMISLYYEILYFNNKKKRNIIISSIFIAIAIAMKSNYLIFLIAEVILVFLNSLDNKKIMECLWIVVYLVIYLISSKIINFSIEKITGVQASDGIPKICWITMGLQENENMASGWYNGYNTNTYSKYNRDSKKVSEAAFNDLKERLVEMSKNPKSTLKFMYDKVISQWNEPTFESVWIMATTVNARDTIVEDGDTFEFLFGRTKEYEQYVSFCNMLHNIILFGTLLYFVLNFKDLSYVNISFALIFIGGFIFHMFWEGKSQYTLPFFILIIPYALMGYNILANIIIDNINKRKKQDIKLIEQ